MRIAIISDIHANFEALRQVWDVITNADHVICLGDMVGYYCQVNEVLDAVRQLQATCVLGNHDAFLLSGCPAAIPESVRFGIAYAERVITSGHRQWLAGLPLLCGRNFDGRSILAVHGSPWNPLDDYLYADSAKLPLLDAFHYDLIAFGQTHRPLTQTQGRPMCLNPGSVGQSRHSPAKATLALWDTHTATLELVERPYNAQPVIHLARENGAGDWILKHLQ
jgi:putative phosphoesterase